MEGIGSAAISSVQPSEGASLEPSCTHTSYSECLASHLMCCETFTGAVTPEPRILDSIALSSQCGALPTIPPPPDHLNQCGGSVGVPPIMAHHLYGHHTVAEPRGHGAGAPSLHVEVLQHSCSSLSISVIREYAVAQLKMQPTAFGEFTLSDFDDPVLKENVISISVCDIPTSIQFLDLTAMDLKVHVYRLHDDGPISEELDEDCDVSAANHWILPSAEFHGLWEQLVYDVGIKQELLDYAETTLLFSDKGVNPTIISWNRVVLLHGPPGTGKTSLCKALAQKLSIRLSQRYSYGQLVEINSHSLFSKWFSESGKLVQKMFRKIQELIDDPDVLVCVLIDEVESLTAARKSAMSGSEPSDAIRVVNALLTQLDQIRRYPNVLILTTSNVTGAIDLAFVDRADVKQYIGLPTPAAIFKIFHSCLSELMRAGIITPNRQILDLRALEIMRFTENEATRLSLRLRDIARRSEGLSGRTLRKIPFLAHALFAKSHVLTLEMYLEALDKAVEKQFAERKELSRE